MWQQNSNEHKQLSTKIRLNFQVKITVLKQEIKSAKFKVLAQECRAKSFHLKSEKNLFIKNTNTFYLVIKK